MYETKWSFEVSGVYISYSSIAEKRTSFRRKLNAKVWIYIKYKEGFFGKKNYKKSSRF